ncbi:Sec-independent protein translocase protein TatB [Hoeflea sp.]|uniref:Sec-independent protein translocase protein TatB n=1 Tax=Hoeflea sp. TaxID=1940281 RepID=UPI003A9592BB
MFDIGWPELLVVAIVLIVVVGPKDLPPMLRAFGRTTKKLRAMASEFRGQFDDALREAELDDVKKTFDDARKLNPMQSIRDAVNPLKDTAKDIKADLEKAVKTPSSAEEPPKMAAPEPSMKLSDGPPEFTAGWPATKPAEAAAKPDSKSAATKKTPAAKPASAKAAKAPASAKAKPAAAKTTKAAASTKAAAGKSPAPKSAAKAATPASRAKAPAKPAAAESAPRAKKPKGEGQA